MASMRSTVAIRYFFGGIYVIYNHEELFFLKENKILIHINFS